MPWFRGNLHTHTTNSDGDSPPDEVVAWYRDAGYDFLALTDHDLVTLPSDHREPAGPMLLVHGEEVTAGNIHLNALGIRETLLPVRCESALETLQTNAGAIRAASAVPSVNHPNFRWQLTPADLAALRGVRLFEVHNAGPETNNTGGRPGHPSSEQIWDYVLSAGQRMFGIAVDDAHFFRVWGRLYSNPGRAWVQVRAARLDEASLLTALEAGECYASTGVQLADIVFDGGALAIDIVPQWDLEYHTTFIGRGGKVLDTVGGLEPRYRLTGSEGYVRARVDDSDGLSAWVQPQFVG
jgi:hypothetical protein